MSSPLTYFCDKCKKYHFEIGDTVFNECQKASDTKFELKNILQDIIDKIDIKNITFCKNNIIIRF